MAENYKRLYESMKKIVKEYQDEIVPGLRAVIENLEAFPRWISVEDGLPELVSCSAGTSYSEAVNVLTSGGNVLIAIWDGDDFISDAEFWGAEDEVVTHWAPVPLPLPLGPL